MKLRDVKYVPDLKYNLISFGMFDAIENGVLRVMKGSMMVLKGFRTNRLYVLDEKIVADSSLMASRKVENYTILKHQQPRQVSEPLANKVS